MIWHGVQWLLHHPERVLQHEQPGKIEMLTHLAFFMCYTSPAHA